MPYDLSQIAEDFKFISDFLSIEKTAQKSSCQLDILDALTLKSFRLRVAQYKLQNCDCFQVILSFLEAKDAVRY